MAKRGERGGVLLEIAAASESLLPRKLLRWNVVFCIGLLRWRVVVVVVVAVCSVVKRGQGVSARDSRKGSAVDLNFWRVFLSDGHCFAFLIQNAGEPLIAPSCFEALSLGTHAKALGRFDGGRAKTRCRRLEPKTQTRSP